MSGLGKAALSLAVAMIVVGGAVWFASSEVKTGELGASSSAPPSLSPGGGFDWSGFRQGIMLAFIISGIILLAIYLRFLRGGNQGEGVVYRPSSLSD